MENNLKKLREREKITQEELAEIINMSVATIKKYEGESQIPIDKGFEISNKFQVSLDWLYCNENTDNEQIINTKTTVELLLSKMKFGFSDKTFNHPSAIITNTFATISTSQDFIVLLSEIQSLKNRKDNKEISESDFKSYLDEKILLFEKSKQRQEIHFFLVEEDFINSTDYDVNELYEQYIEANYHKIQRNKGEKTNEE